MFAYANTQKKIGDDVENQELIHLSIKTFAINITDNFSSVKRSLPSVFNYKMLYNKLLCL